MLLLFTSAHRHDHSIYVPYRCAACPVTQPDAGCITGQPDAQPRGECYPVA